MKLIMLLLLISTTFCLELKEARINTIRGNYVRITAPLEGMDSLSITIKLSLNEIRNFTSRGTIPIWSSRDTLILDLPTGMRLIWSSQKAETK